MSKIKDNSSWMQLLGRLDNQEFDTGNHFVYFISVKFSFDNLIETLKHAVNFFSRFWLQDQKQKTLPLDLLKKKSKLPFRHWLNRSNKFFQKNCSLIQMSKEKKLSFLHSDGSLKRWTETFLEGTKTILTYKVETDWCFKSFSSQKSRSWRLRDWWWWSNL